MYCIKKPRNQHRELPRRDPFLEYKIYVAVISKRSIKKQSYYVGIKEVLKYIYISPHSYGFLMSNEATKTFFYKDICSEGRVSSWKFLLICSMLFKKDFLENQYILGNHKSAPGTFVSVRYTYNTCFKNYLLFDVKKIRPLENKYLFSEHIKPPEKGAPGRDE